MHNTFGTKGNRQWNEVSGGHDRPGLRGVLKEDGRMVGTICVCFSLFRVYTVLGLGGRKEWMEEGMDRCKQTIISLTAVATTRCEGRISKQASAGGGEVIDGTIIHLFRRRRGWGVRLLYVLWEGGGL